MSALKRDEMFQLRIASSELEMLRALAEEEGQPAAAILRTMIRRMYAAKFGEVIAPAAKKTPAKKRAAKKGGK